MVKNDKMKRIMKTEAIEWLNEDERGMNKEMETQKRMKLNKMKLKMK